MDSLADWANIFSICAFLVTLIGAVVGICGYIDYKCKWRKKKTALETYLRDAKNSVEIGKKGQKTATHLVRHLGLTEDEILNISFESKHIERRVSEDSQGNAGVLYFVYVD